MKKVFNSLFVIIAAMVTFAGCAKQEIDAPATPETKTVQFFANSIETKTAFGTPDGNIYPTLWTAGDKVKVHVNLSAPSGVTKTEASVDVKLVGGEDMASSATFTAELNDAFDAESYTLYSVSPSSAWNARSTKEGRFTVNIESEQTPLPTSVDSDVQVLYAISGPYTNGIPTSVNLDYKHFTAYGKLSLEGLAAGVVISKIKLESADLDLAGKWNYYVADETVAAKDGVKYITLETSSTTDIWFACAPVDVSNKTLTLTVTTNQGDFVKELNFPANRKFEAGKISKFTVDMTGITAGGTDEPEQPGETTAYYEKVTSAPADWSGKYLIVYEDGTNAYVFNGLDAVNGYVSAVISDGKIASTTDLENVSVNIESMEGGYSVKTSNGYIYGNASKNQLNFDTSTPKLNTISYSDNSVKITSGRVLSFNSASDQMRFRYYTDGNQKAIQLYKLAGTESGGEGGGETPELTDRNLKFSTTTASAIVGQDFIEPSLSGEISGVVYSSSNTAVATVDATTGEVTPVAAGETTITATAAADATYKAGEASYTLTVSAAQGGGDQPVEVVTYQHIITKKPGTGSVTLSDVIWTLDATNLNSYNSQNYAGVQFGTSSKTGTIKLTSENPFTYDGKSNVKEIRLWLNNGSGTITPKVTINGVECTMTGTIVKNSNAGSDYTKASLVKFTPTQPISGIVVIDLSCNKAGYFCAMEIDVQ